MNDEKKRKMLRKEISVISFLIVCVLMIPAMEACSRKGVSSTTAQTESQPTPVRPPVRSPAPTEKGTVPGPPEGLRGFTPDPPEEPTRFSSVPPITAGQRPASARAVARKVLATVYFGFNRSSLSHDGRQQLEPAVAFLRRNPDTGVVIEGHCDERGTHEYNLVLGEKRAQEVRKTLAELHVTNRMSTKSLGKEQPVCAERSESCYSQNRRAHVMIDQSP
jgi:peptidoglycan-associated lipoprotein